MSNNTNGILLRHILQLEENDKLDLRLNELLSETLSDLSVKNGDLHFSFKNGITVILHKDFESYRIFISEPSFYQNENSSFTPIGEDRVLFYLKTIANFKYERNYKKQ